MKTLYGVPWIRYVTPVVLWLISVGYVIMAVGYSAEARLVPLLVGSLLVILVPLDIASLAKNRLGERLRATVNPVANEPLEVSEGWRQQLRAIGWMLSLPILILLIGVVPATFFYLVGSLRALGRKSWLMALITGTISAGCAYFLFQLLLGIELYPGYVVELLYPDH